MSGHSLPSNSQKFGRVPISAAVSALVVVLASCGENDKPAETGKGAVPNRYFRAETGTPTFFFRALFADVRRSAFAFERLPSGAVRFIDAYDHREYVMTQPYEMEERPFPKSAVTSGSERVSAEKAKEMAERTKFYVVSSYATGKRKRFQTFRYKIDENGTVYLAHGTDHLAIPPPYVIEEDFLGSEKHPRVPDYPPSPDRG